MQICRLPGEEAAVRRFLAELWIPYNRELEDMIDGFALAGDIDVLEAELVHRLERHEESDYRAWVAVEGAADGGDIAEGAGDLVGFVTTDVDGSPPVFDRPTRVVVCDIYVGESHRGTGLARDLIDRAREDARERDIEELRLDVDVANERALAFYDKLGFEPTRHSMVAPVDDA